MSRVTLQSYRRIIQARRGFWHDLTVPVRIPKTTGNNNNNDKARVDNQLSRRLKGEGAVARRGKKRFLKEKEGKLLELPDAKEWGERMNQYRDDFLNSASERAARVGLKMDRRWWRWQIALAMLPAMIIAAYCEFVGQAQMLEYYKHQHIQKQREIYGDSYDEQNDEYLQSIQSNFLLWGKLKEGLRESFPSLMQNQDAEKSPTPQQKTALQGGSDRTEKDQAPKETQEDTSLEGLAKRIHQLELKLLAQEQQKIQELQRKMNQSGIQNRMEDKNRHQPMQVMQPKMSQSTPSESGDEPRFEKWRETIWDMVREAAEKKMDEVRGSAKEQLGHQKDLGNSVNDDLAPMSSTSYHVDGPLATEKLPQARDALASNAPGLTASDKSDVTQVSSIAFSGTSSEETTSTVKEWWWKLLSRKST